MSEAEFAVKRFELCDECNGEGKTKHEIKSKLPGWFFNSGPYYLDQCNKCDGIGATIEWVRLQDALTELGADILYHK